MEKYIEYCINIQGQKAVDAGYKYIGPDYCTRILRNKSGKWMGQMEVVLDDPEEIYKGIPSQWVAISFIKRENVEWVFNHLSKIGFAGCPCTISQENLENERPDGKPDDGELCCMII